MLGLGPGRVVITDGSAGAFGTDGTRYLEVPVFPDDGRVVDRTGAGDAFAGTLVAVRGVRGSLEERAWPGPRSTRCVWCNRSARRPGSSGGAPLEDLLAGAPPGYGVRDLAP